MVHIAKWKIYLVLIVCFLGLVFASPNLLDRTIRDRLPGWMPGNPINLGLDLRGGAHLLMKVDVDKAIEPRVEGVVDGIRDALRKERVRYANLGSQGFTVGVTIRDAGSFEKARELIAPLDPDMALRDDGNGRFTLTLTEQGLKRARDGVMEQTIEIVRRRVDETGVREPTIQRQGDAQVVLQLPGLDDPQRLKDLLGKTAKMTFHLVDEGNSVLEARTGRVPPGSFLAPSMDEREPSGAPRVYLLKKRVMVSGENLTNAQPTVDNRGQPAVSIVFDSIGARKFAKATTENVQKPFAIVLDGEVISAPVIREPIIGGRGQISGSMSVREAQDLALLLRAGALPAPLYPVEERSVGPGLGADSIAAGKVASIVGLVLVVAFMGVAYGKFGLMADIALMMNIILIVAALSILQATLTLPGIAGIVLTVGMAVDANVLIFERIREETRLGLSPIRAIDSGYSNAMRTIVDANATTLIAAVLLYQFGSGPVRGFAVTLAIGILTSMFTAIMVTRLIVIAWYDRKKPKVLEI